MKDSKPPRRKIMTMRVVSHKMMTAQEESIFTKAIDALLAELVRTLDRRRGEFIHGEKEQMAG